MRRFALPSVPLCSCIPWNPPSAAEYTPRLLRSPTLVSTRAVQQLSHHRHHHRPHRLRPKNRSRRRSRQPRRLVDLSTSKRTPAGRPRRSAGRQRPSRHRESPSRRPYSPGGSRLREDTCGPRDCPTSIVTTAREHRMPHPLPLRPLVALRLWFQTSRQPPSTSLW